MHLHHNCHQDCDHGNCPWIYVGREEKYVCLKCDKEKYLSSNWGGIIWVILIALLVALAGDNKPSQTPPTPVNQEQPTSQNLRRG